MPKSIEFEDAPRRRRPRKTAKGKSSRSETQRPGKTEGERGLIMRVLLHSPKDTVAGVVALGAVVAVVVNAMFLQTARHPSPMFGASVVLFPPEEAPAKNFDQFASPDAANVLSNQTTSNPATAPAVSPMPRPRPSTADQRSDVRPEAETRHAIARIVDPIGHFVKGSAPASDSPVIRPPATVPTSARSSGDPLGALIVSTRRVAGVQRALTAFGYGQLKPTGEVGPDTRAAIKRFEEERGLPITGQISDRMVRELVVVTGERID